MLALEPLLRHVFAIGVLLGMIALSSLMRHFGSPTSTNAPATLGKWRRTPVGWTSTYEQPVRTTDPNAAHLIHPAVVATLQTLLSVGALLSFSEWKQRRADS